MTPTFQMHSEMQQHTLVFFGMPHRLGKPNNNNNEDNTKNKMIFTQEAPLTRTRFSRRSCNRIELELGKVDNDDNKNNYGNNNDN